MVRLAVLGLALLSCLCAADENILNPDNTSGKPVALVLVGRNDTALSAYVPLAKEIQSEMAPNFSAWVVLRTDTDGVDDTLSKLETEHNVTEAFFVGHSMTGKTGGVAVQNYVKANPDKVRGMVLLAGFLLRTQRPDIVTCLAKAKDQPKKSFKYPLGYLKDGAHDCYGPNTPEFPVPTLTVGGELDGVVRITRIAEAFYTQTVLKDQSADLPVVVLEGLNHAAILNGTVSKAVQHMDLKAELSPADALTLVSKTISTFVTTRHGATRSSAAALDATRSLTALTKQATDFFSPIVEAFVEQEGNWFFTGGDDEHGTSDFAAQAQKAMALPTPDTYQWDMANEFHLLSDEDKIPPYYREKHRPHVIPMGPDNRTMNASTVTQLRFIELTVTQTLAGLSGSAIIEEEKLNILTALPDDGSFPVSAIELGTKLASRQKVWNVTGHDAPDSLDDGDRCKSINQLAVDWADSKVGDATKKRFDQYGLPLVMVGDKKPSIPAGPWWIWNYLQYNKKSTHVEVQSWYAFFSTSSNPYGAGNHYCKLLSPARALEWMYVDGLRDNYHV